MVALTFESPFLLWHLTFSEQRKEVIQEINLKHFLDGLSMTREQFVDLCVLMGCDHLDQSSPRWP